MRKVKIELRDDVYEMLLEKGGKGDFAKYISGLIEKDKPELGETVKTSSIDEDELELLKQQQRTLLTEFKKLRRDVDSLMRKGDHEPVVIPIQTTIESNNKPEPSEVSTVRSYSSLPVLNIHPLDINKDTEFLPAPSDEELLSFNLSDVNYYLGAECGWSREKVTEKMKELLKIKNAS